MIDGSLAKHVSLKNFVYVSLSIDNTHINNFNSIIGGLVS